MLVHGAFADGSGWNGVIERLQAKGVKVTAPYSHRVLDGIGHNLPQEAPEAFADAILEVGAAK